MSLPPGSSAQHAQLTAHDVHGRQQRVSTSARRSSLTTLDAPPAPPETRRASAGMVFADKPTSIAMPLANHPFPTLPPLLPEPGQARQTQEQMTSIITLPPVLLAQLARTGEFTEQKKYVDKMHAGDYLGAMSLPPPSPAEETWAPAGSRLTHQGIPLLLQQVFSPQTSGIIATAPMSQPQFQVFASPDQWARSEAEARGSFDPEQLEQVSNRLKEWAFSKMEQEVHHTVYGAKGTAVDLAAKAAAQQKAVSRSPSTSASARPRLVRQSTEIDAYAEHYKLELNALASGYYSKLHREALATLLSNPGTRSGEQSAVLVRASAVAALTANVMAANDMARSAGETLSSMGVDVAAVASPAPVHPTYSASLVPSEEAQTEGAMLPGPYVGGAQVGSAGMPAAAAAASTTVAAAIQQAAIDNRCTPETRDYLLAWAHQTYSKVPDDPSLLPVLNMLNRLHPMHSPTMLLLSCVHYSQGVKKGSDEDLQASIYWNSEIIKLDADYVEAMSNIGTTLRALGRNEDAEQWWWQALEKRPTYFDAFDNLLGVLCNPGVSKSSTAAMTPTKPRLDQAIKLCDFVEDAIYRDAAQVDQNVILRPLGIPQAVPLTHIHRLQNLFYAKGNLCLAMGNPVVARQEYEKGIEPLLSTPEGVGQYTLRDLLVAGTLVGLEFMSQASGGLLPSPVQLFHLQSNDWLRIARERGSRLSDTLRVHGGGFFPTVLLSPSDVQRYAPSVFLASNGVLPTLSGSTASVDAPNQTTSTILLTLAKLFQDAAASPSSALARDLARSGLPASPAIVLPLYYFSISLHPSPSTYNNLGILLSSIASVTPIMDVSSGRAVQVTGQHLAMQFYQAGLSRDAKHPHLYTNLGSLLKDTGQLQQAVQMYQKAVECNPNFDVALANLGNALKDMGHVQDSVQWYRRAVDINPNFPEAVCGLVNALGGVCDWRGRGASKGELGVDPNGKLQPARDGLTYDGWMPKIAAMVDRQLDEGASYGRGCMASLGGISEWLNIISGALFGKAASAMAPAEVERWQSKLSVFLDSDLSVPLPRTLNEGGFAIRLIERLMRRIQRRWYLDTYGPHVSGSGRRILPSERDAQLYHRPVLPPTLPIASVPTVLPFHTFTYPLGARATRLISHRNALRISHTSLSQPWLPQHVYPPPAPPQPRLHVGYVSSDFNNHPLAHLMQSVFGLHDRSRFSIFCYATTPTDRSPYRQKIETETEHFIDVSSWSNQQVVERILADGIHVLCNLNGYTKGARNEIFAARPCPVTMQFMGFAGTMAAGWNDWFLADPIVSPPDTTACEVWRSRQTAGLAEAPTDLGADIDPEEDSENWVYTERFCFMPGTYFCTDHKQSFNDKPILAASTAPNGVVTSTTSIAGDMDFRWKQEESKRWQMRRELFPDVTEDTIIFCCMNQLYKIDPFIFRIWLKILAAVPNSILWLLRFPAAGEPHLKRFADQWAGPNIAKRVVFTDVASKNAHIERGRIADLFLDATECSAHTTCADILWAGTPVVTWPRHRSKFCSRVAASIVTSTGLADQMVVSTEEHYVARAISLATSVSFVSETQPDGTLLQRGQGELYDLRKTLFLSRDNQQLFDTVAWTRNVEKGYWEAWRRWVTGTEFEDTPEWAACQGPEKASSSIYVAHTPAVP